jgi:imidazolonepropionase-like amidohydrolase
MGNQTGDPVKEALNKIEEVKNFFRDAKNYIESNPVRKNLKLEATRNLFNKKAKLFIHCDQVKQILLTIDFVREFNFDVVIVGGSESWQVADLLKQNNIAVILSQLLELPEVEDDDIDQTFKVPAVLEKAGVLFCINDDDSQNRGRNLAFNAGTAATYGLDKEKSISSITFNTAKILGIEDRTGSIKVGKDANIIITEGDILDMKNSNVIKAYIQGREIELNDKHKQLYERYKYKYVIK